MKDMLELLQERMRCSAEMAEIVLSCLEKIDPSLQRILNRWVENETDVDDETEAQGYTTASLMREFGMQFTGAILTMDGLIKQPELTKQALSEALC